MIYSQEITQIMLNDPRWIGAINENMIRIWRSRNVIPNQYFNQKYVELIVSGNADLANQVKDPYYNENFAKRFEQSKAEKVEHDKIVKILENDKIRTAVLLREVNIPYNLYCDAIRKDDNKQVDLRASHILKIKKHLQSWRIKIKVAVEKYQDKQTFGENDRLEIEKLLIDEKFVVKQLLQNETYFSRFSKRKNKKSNFFEDDEMKHIIASLAIFLLETGL